MNIFFKNKMFIIKIFTFYNPNEKIHLKQDQLRVLHLLYLKVYHCCKILRYLIMSSQQQLTSFFFYLKYNSSFFLFQLHKLYSNTNKSLKIYYKMISVNINRHPCCLDLFRFELSTYSCFIYRNISNKNI